MQTLLYDLRFALRQLRQSPGFAATAVLTLALGIGASTAMFSLINAVLIRKLPYKDPQNLVFLWTPNPRFPVPLEVMGPLNADFFDLRRQNHSFTVLSLFDTERLNLSTGSTAVRVGGSRVTGDFFATLGVVPQIGRTVDMNDDQSGKEQVVVISHALWQSEFGGERHIIGKTLLLEARPYRVIGVMPAGFAFPHATDILDTVAKRTDVWIPWAMTPAEKADRDNGQGDAIGRLRPGVTVEQAQTEMNLIMARIDGLHAPEMRGFAAVVKPLVASVTGGSRRALLLLMGAVTLVLLIACSNVASLVMVRAMCRIQEISVRSALGAGRLRLVRQFLAEALLLAGLGGPLGAFVAFAAIRLVLWLDPGNIPRLEETSLDGRVLFFTIGVSVVTGLLFGILPVLSAFRINVIEALKASPGRSVKGRSSRLRRGLIVGEVALTVVLLAGSGLLIRSLLKLNSVDKGFEPRSTVTMNLSLDARYNQPAKQSAFYREVIGRIEALPGVRAVGAINDLPLSRSESVSWVTVEGYPLEEKLFFQTRSVTSHYFEAMSIPLLKGRSFSEGDLASSPLVAVVSRSLARRYFPNESALGKRLHFNMDNTNPTWWTIVGVVPDVRQLNLEETPPMQVYTPLWQSGSQSAFVVVRTDVEPGQLASAIRTVVHELDPTLAVADIRTMNQLISETTAIRRFQTLLLSVFAGVALFLSLVGLYALMAHSVQQRTAEVGIRMALGAQPRDVLRLILKEGIGCVFLGIVLGTVGAWGVTRLMASLLFQVKPSDPMTFVGAVVLLMSAGARASYIPARRAAKFDPMVALRYE